MRATSRWTVGALFQVALGLILCPGGCVPHPVGSATGEISEEAAPSFQQGLKRDVDILFVIDTSFTMSDDQENLKRNFSKLIDGLRMVDLGPETEGAPCNPGNTSGCKIPNVRIGVTSADLGLPVPDESWWKWYEERCRSPIGDDGRLLATPREPGCVAPTPEHPFIEYISRADGTVQTPGLTGGPPRAIDRVKEAFGCIAALGTDGCGFEQQLEAARRALDPDLGKNPGFLRDSALLAVVLITDEDDCSARDTRLFDPTQRTLSTALGPPTDFRCFEFGIRCDDNGRGYGQRPGCTPYEAGDPMLAPVGRGEKPFDQTPLTPPGEYIDFFRRLKPGNNLIISAIAGPAQDVYIEKEKFAVRQGILIDVPRPGLSCSQSFPDPGEGEGSEVTASARPALRIKRVVDAFGQDGQFSSICTSDFGPALSQLADRIRTKLGAQCLSRPPLTPEGAVACREGDSFARDAAGDAIICAAGCLHRAACNVSERTPGLEASTTIIERCAEEIWYPQDWQAERACDPCPCWRLVSKEASPAGQQGCEPQAAGTPYALDILRGGAEEAAQGAIARINCRVSSAPWGSEALAELPRCSGEL